MNSSTLDGFTNLHVGQVTAESFFCEVTDDVIVLSESYYPRCFLDRDEFMVNYSSKLIGYYDGREKGGTFYTIRKAMAQNIPIVNVF